MKDFGMQVMSLNELSFEELAAGKAPILVVIASSTGEGEAPDNAAKFYATMRSAPRQFLCCIEGTAYTSVLHLIMGKFFMTYTPCTHDIFSTLPWGRWVG
jgi:sulfite reductase alpha subunit-like flavoprotein